MATTDELRESLDSFAQSCNENQKLKAMIREWNRVLHIHATDTKTDLTLTTSQGDVTVTPSAPPTADMVIRSTAEILTAVFYGELSPNEPYNEGTLRIQGSEDDIVRLDFIIAMLWEE